MQSLWAFIPQQLQQLQNNKERGSNSKECCINLQHSCFYKIKIIKMKKNILFVLGILLVLYSLATVSQYIGDYSILTEYGKGFVFGKIILFAIGIILIAFGVKKKKNIE